MEGFSKVRFVVLDTRCFCSSLLPIAEEFFYVMKESLQQYFNLLKAIAEDSLIISFIVVTHHKVEVLMKPSRVDIAKLYKVVEKIVCSGLLQSTSDSLDPAIRALKMIESCLTKFPLGSSLFQVAYISSHQLEVIHEEELSNILHALDSNAMNISIEFICLASFHRHEEVERLEGIVSPFLNCRVKFLPDSSKLKQLFRGWIEHTTSQKIEFNIGNIYLRCFATKRILPLEIPLTEVCLCHSKPLELQKVCQKTRKLLSTTKKIQSVSEGCTEREIEDPVEIGGNVALDVLRRLPLSSISEDVLIGDCYIVTPEEKYSEDAEDNRNLFFALAECLGEKDMGLTCEGKYNLMEGKTSHLTFHYLVMSRSDNKCLLLRQLASEEQCMGSISWEASHIRPHVTREHKKKVQAEIERLHLGEYALENYSSHYHEQVTYLMNEKGKNINCTLKRDHSLAIRKSMAANSRNIASDLLRKRTRTELNK